MRPLLLSVHPWLLAAEPDLGLSQLGVYGVTVAILLWIVKMLWSDNRDLRANLEAVQSKSLERVTAVATEASMQSQETARTLTAAQQALDRSSAAPILSPEDLYRLRTFLTEFETIIRESKR